MTIKVIIVLSLVAFALASAIGHHNLPKHHKPSTTTQRIEVEWIEPRHIPIRKIRSPDGGSVGVNIDHNDKSGTTGSINASGNVYTSPDGHTSVDVSGSASKNFDHGNSDSNVGLSLTHTFDKK